MIVFVRDVCGLLKKGKLTGHTVSEAGLEQTGWNISAYEVTR